MRSTLSLAFALTFFHSAQAIPRAEVATAATTAPSLTRALRPRPTVGSTWHIQLEKGTAKSPLDLNLPVDVYDVDLFDTDANTQIAKLHENNKYVICYFSAGTYEPDRPDSALLSNIMDYKNSTLNELKDWPGEFWLDVTSDNVMKIMRNRITLAANKSCDGIDPDNLDGYAPDNKNEMGLTPEKLTDYIKKLSTFAQSQGLRMGLKNAGEIVGDVKNVTDWVVQEQCGGWNNVTFEDDDCALWRPFIDDKKPVFRIEYLWGAPPNPSPRNITRACFAPDTDQFSTVLKQQDFKLTAWSMNCSHAIPPNPAWPKTLTSTTDLASSPTESLERFRGVRV